MKSKVDLYLNDSRTKVVTEDDPEARFLLVNAGREIPDGEIVALGEGLLSQARDLSSGPEEKAAEAPPENKAVDRAPNKRAGRSRANKPAAVSEPPAAASAPATEPNSGANAPED